MKYSLKELLQYKDAAILKQVIEQGYALSALRSFPHDSVFVHEWSLYHTARCLESWFKDLIPDITEKEFQSIAYEWWNKIDEEAD